MARKKKNDLARGARRLWESYSRGEAPGPLDRAAREAYDAYYAPSNAPKLALCLEEAGWRFPRERPARLLDLGAGPGTFARAALELAGGGPGLAALLLDLDEKLLGRARRSFAEGAARTAAPGSFEIETFVRDLGTTPLLPSYLRKPPFDLAVLGNSLGEAFPEADDAPAAAELVRHLAQDLLAPGGLVIVIEPALRVSSRRLLAVRDLLAAEEIFPLAPCLCRGPCPTLLNEKDWCHEDRPWTPPEEVRALAGELGHLRDALKFSFLCYGRENPPAPDGRRWRVVSEPLPGKGKWELFLCGPGGRRRFRLLKRHLTTENADFAEAGRGDILEIEELSPEDSSPGETDVRLAPESRVRLVRRAPEGAEA